MKTQPGHFRFNVPRDAKDKRAAIKLMHELRDKIRAAGAEPRAPELWEDDIVIYNNSLLEQLEDAKKAVRV